ncbi:hypothetical protein [Methylobacterium frigidaeris]|uniref:hypothetical protein n=1 Tax=Methylobacterium frigidaeris TaxID=2038277 RepID=UPI001EDD07BA|nr:hypothetical protein [Methylobacterium frigidaeris]
MAAEELFSTLRATPMLTGDQAARVVRDFYDLILTDENASRLTRAPARGRARGPGHPTGSPAFVVHL